MRSPGLLKRGPIGVIAVSMWLLASTSTVLAQWETKTRVWHGTKLVEPEPPQLRLESAPMPRELDSRPREPERLPPIQIQLQQPQIGSDPIQTLLSEMANARRIDRLEHKTDVMQREIERQGVRQVSSVDPNAPNRLPDSAMNPAPVASESGGNLKIELGRSDAQPSLTNMVLTQLAAIVGAIVIVSVLFFCLQLMFLRRSGGLGSLFKIEMIGTHAPSAGEPAPIAEAIPPEPEPEPWGEVTPNFDIGPTYEEERQMAEEAERNKDKALLMHIFQENQKMQEEISNLPPDMDPALMEAPESMELMETQPVAAK